MYQYTEAFSVTIRETLQKQKNQVRWISRIWTKKQKNLEDKKIARKKRRNKGKSSPIRMTLRMKWCGEWKLENSRQIGVCMRNTADLRKDIRFILEWHLRYIVIISLAIRQCAAWSSTLITHNFPERRNLGNKRKPTHQVYLPYVPTCGLSTPSTLYCRKASTIIICLRLFFSCFFCLTIIVLWPHK